MHNTTQNVSQEAVTRAREGWVAFTRILTLSTLATIAVVAVVIAILVLA